MPIRVVAAVIRRGDCFLVCERPVHKRHGGLWEFPGGKIEAGENVPQAIRRELLEELAVTPVFIGHLLDVVEDPGSPFSIEFHEVAIEGEPQCREHSQLAWVARAELAAYPLAPSDAQFVARTLTPS